VRTTDRDAEFTAFVAARRARLLRAARLLAAGDEALAEDLVQTTLTKVYVAWPKVRRADDPVRYAHRMLTNAFIDETRRAHRSRELSEPGPVEPRTTVAEPDDPTVRDAVMAALAGLAPQQRAVVVLRHWLDLDVQATAQALGCSTGTVKSTNSRALAHLRTALAHLTDDLTIRSTP
jgi:RNA polymerase sigma-70 factor (sigma-E family)